MLPSSSRNDCPPHTLPPPTPYGTWAATAAPPYAAYPACPFLRPWDACAADSPCRAAAWASTAFTPSPLSAAPLLDAPALHSRYAGRTILFVGDSIQVQHFSSFACLLHAAGGSPVNHSTLRWRSPHTLHKRCGGAALCHYEHGCVTFASSLRLCVCAIVALDPKLYARCRSTYRPTPSDVVYYGSIGVHYTGEMGAKALPSDVRRLAAAEVALVLRAFGASRLLWREVTAQHFAHAGGHYRQADAEDNYNRKTASASPCFSNHSLREMADHQRWNGASLPRLAAANVSVVAAWGSSALAWDGHVEYGDCTHWCLPGLPDAWGHMLARLLGVATVRSPLPSPLPTPIATPLPSTSPPPALPTALPTLATSPRHATPPPRRRLCTAPGSHALPPPHWPPSSPTRLLVAVDAPLASPAPLAALRTCLCLLSTHMPSAALLLLAHGEHAAAALPLAAAVRLSPRPLSSLEAIAAAAAYASSHAASHFAFLRHTSQLLRPLPLPLRCPFVPLELRVGRPPRAEAWLAALLAPLPLPAAAVASHAFLCDAATLALLLASPLLSTCTPTAAHDEASEFLLAALAASAASPPLRCHLDGCASPASAREAAACFASPPFLSHLAGEPPSALPLPPPAACGLPPLPTPTHRHFGPSAAITRPIFAGLDAAGAPLYGAAAHARLTLLPPSSRRLLIYVHSFAISPFEKVHAAMLALPCTRSLPLVATAGLLLASNNRHLPTSHLLARLHAYAQPHRWVFHSPTNPGSATEHKPGYLCGEMTTLAESSAVWSAYAWVLYSNPDVVATPLFLANLSSRLAAAPAVDLFADRFPQRWRRPPFVRYSMECLVFRTDSFLERRLANGSAPSVFAAAVRRCVKAPRGVFPEVAMRAIAEERALRVERLGAVHYVRASQQEVDGLLRQGVLARLAPPGWNVDVSKTALLPGAVWHNEDLPLAQEYLRDEAERTACAS